MRVLQWVVDRIHGRAQKPVESPFGLMPQYQDLNWTGLTFTPDRFAKIMAVDPGEAKREALDQQELFDRFGSRLPSELEEERQSLLSRIEAQQVAAK
jgi:phosphoenolpyruvate carboxykinase (GTP)